MYVSYTNQVNEESIGCIQSFHWAQMYLKEVMEVLNVSKCNQNEALLLPL